MRNWLWYTKLTGLVLLGFMLAGYQNCGVQQKFSQGAVDNLGQGNSGGSGGGAVGINPVGGGNSAPVQTCSTVLKNSIENLRIMFMVDNSDSTAGRSGTDPNKVYRVDVLQNFLTAYSSKTNFNYFFGSFAPGVNIWDVSSNSFQSNPKNPIGAASDLSKALLAFEPLAAQAGTAYKAAFAGIQSSIDAIAKPNDGWNYAVVFMSDGMPTDCGQASGQVACIQSLVSNLTADVKSHGAAVSVSSVYFGPESDANSINNLQSMAAFGSGQFIDTNKVTSLTISDVIQVPGQVCTTN